MTDIISTTKQQLKFKEIDDTFDEYLNDFDFSTQVFDATLEHNFDTKTAHTALMSDKEKIKDERRRQRKRKQRETKSDMKRNYYDHLNQDINQKALDTTLNTVGSSQNTKIPKTMENHFTESRRECVGKIQLTPVLPPSVDPVFTAPTIKTGTGDHTFPKYCEVHHENMVTHYYEAEQVFICSECLSSRSLDSSRIQSLEYLSSLISQRIASLKTLNESKKSETISIVGTLKSTKLNGHSALQDWKQEIAALVNEFYEKQANKINEIIKKKQQNIEAAVSFVNNLDQNKLEVLSQPGRRFTSSHEVSKFLALLNRFEVFINQKEQKIQGLRTIQRQIQEEINEIIESKNSMKTNIISILANQPIKSPVQLDMKVAPVDKENIVPDNTNLLAKANPNASVHDSVKKILKKSLEQKAEELVNPKAAINLRDFEGNKENSLFKLESDRTPLGILNDGNQIEDDYSTSDLNFKEYIKPEIPEQEINVPREENEEKVSILSDLPIREYLNMNKNFQVKRIEMEPDGEALRLESLDSFNGFTVLKHFLSMPNVVPFMINTKLKYCSSFIFYNTESFEIIKRVDLCQNHMHPLLSITNIGKKWYFLQRENTTKTVRDKPRCYLYKLLYINVQDDISECIFQEYIQEKKALMATSQNKLYITFINHKTLMYDTDSQKWEKLPGLKLPIKGNSMIRMHVIRNEVIYIFWTGFSSDLGNNIYYLQLEEQEYWNRLSIEVDERDRQLSKCGIIYLSPKTENDHDAFIIFGGVQKNAMTGLSYEYDTKTQLVLRRNQYACLVRDHFGAESYYQKDDKHIFVIGVSTMHIFDISQRKWDVKSLEE
ncbi:unnamed protein product [Moneuplotes crassus]|uniref:Kelch motif family protein n=1 Tax=Euplotes crassus TaxID=5936 RepID=A0AAD2D908_EUPCR|nr:unnamed protein product [Moneuplotes crassus]